MAFKKLNDDKNPAGSAAKLGVLAITIASILLLASIYSTFRQLGYFSLVLWLVGISFAALGYKNTKSIGPIFIFLLLVMPLPFLIHNNVSLFLKTISTNMGVDILQLLGYSVYQDGNIIDLGQYKLQVVDACNGMRFLFPTLSLSYLIAYLYKGSMTKRVAIFISAIPITILMNSLRIASIGILVNVWGPSAAEGVSHTVQGYLVFLLNIICIMAASVIMTKTNKNDTIDWSFLTIPDFKSGDIKTHIGKYSLSFLLVGIITLTLVNFNPFKFMHSDIKIQAPELYRFPLNIDKWVGSQDILQSDIVDELNLSDYLLINYKDPNAERAIPINLYIAYYNSQEIGTAIHSPKTCIPGGGWEITSTDTVTLDDIIYDGAPLKVMRLEISKGRSRQLVYYWFDERSRIVTDQFSAKYHLMIDSILTGRSDGALIRVITVLDQNEDSAKADKRLKTFIKDMLPYVKTSIRNN